MRVIRLCALGPALTALACSTGERVARAPAADSAFTPTQYSVADFYSNVEYTGASFSPDGSRLRSPTEGTSASKRWTSPAECSFAYDVQGCWPSM